MASKQLERYNSSQILAQDLKLPPIKDSDLALILFLATGPKHEEHMEILDGPNGPIRSPKNLIEKLKQSLTMTSMEPLKQALLLRLLALKKHNVSRQLPFNIVESNFSDEDDKFSDEEEDILEFVEIFKMLNIPVPDFLKEKFDEIVTIKKTPIRDINRDDSHDKTFFIYSENKIFSEICNILTPHDVCRIYSLIKEYQLKDEDLKQALNIPINEESIEKTPGLKDVAFYFLILNLVDKEKLNRLHTHLLKHILKKIMEKCEEDNEEDGSRFKEALVKLRCYPVSSNPPGICIIFCMEKDREGSGKDVKIVKALFEDTYHYHVIVKRNPSSEEISSVASKLKAPRNKFYDSLVVWFMGHGSLNGLSVADKEIDRRKEFISLFTDISWLNKKPKLFFIQACSNDQESSKVEGKRRSSALIAESDSAGLGLSAGRIWKGNYGDYLDTSVNNCADTLIAYATTWDEEAARQRNGSLYVATVVDQLYHSGHIESIENVLRKVHYNTNQVLLQKAGDVGAVPWKQTPYYECSLQKEFMFPRSPSVVL